ncbi:hypothetical protein KC326_g132 [Hortaea werneckii]|nr:hypothetical protein KC326_g132 [Hortaea werneckii]
MMGPRGMHGAIGCCARSKRIHAKQFISVRSLGDKSVHIQMPFLIVIEKQVVPIVIDEYAAGASFGEIAA